VAISYVRSSPKGEFLETIFSTLFKTTFFVQIMVRKPVTNSNEYKLTAVVLDIVVADFLNQLALRKMK
jgi:hypothetical protein